MEEENMSNGLEKRANSLEEVNQQMLSDPECLSKEEFKVKLAIWICLCWSFIVLGWTMAQLGPSLLDLKEITGSSLDEASLFVTATFVGYLSGAVINGFIYERMNPFIILFSSIFILALSSAAIPFCSFYELMVFMHIVKGVGAGILDSAGNSLLMLKFRNEKSARSFLQTLHFTFALGGIISPMVTAPFLMPVEQRDTNVSTLHSLSSEGMSKSTTKYVSELFKNRSMTTNLFDNITHKTVSDIQSTSELYKAYLITAVLCIMAAVPFVIWYCAKPKSCSEESLKSTERPLQTLPLHLTVVILVLMCLFLGIDNGMEDAFFGFLTTYSVTEYGWTKEKGSYVASLYWAAYAIGRFSAIFIVPFFKPSILLKIYSKLLILSVVGLFVTTYFNYDTGVWIFTPFTGFAISVFFPSIFLWTEEDFVAVTGRVASLLMFSASLGSMINPIIIGYLMDNFSSRCFVYITFGQAIAILALTWIVTLLSRHVKRYIVKTEMEINVD